MNKKHLLAPLSLAIILALTGCDSSSSAGTAKTGSSEPEGAPASRTSSAAAEYQFPQASCQAENADGEDANLPFDEWESAKTDFGQISCKGVDLAKLAQVDNSGKTFALTLKDIPEPEEIVDMSGVKFGQQGGAGIDVSGHIGPNAAASLATLDVDSLNVGDDGTDVDLVAFKDSDFKLLSADKMPANIKEFIAISAAEKHIGRVGGDIKGEDVPTDLPQDIIVTVDASSEGADKARNTVGVNTYEKVILKASDKGTLELAKLPDFDWQPGEYGMPDWLSGETMDIAKYRQTSDGMNFASKDAVIKIDGKQKKISHSIMVSEQ